ncbi:MAG TPA: YbjN domain-containing protein [Beijerinckiaceae bacterium]|mgnify:CR=1 FL=1|nr:YbjN domain-containing protein [Beijerinckiaceae bacterium]
MSLTDVAQDRNEHPVDMVERVASLNQWAFERSDEDEISISVGGGWSDYHVSFTWLEDMDSLHMGAAFDLKVPDGRRAEVLKLISFINEQLWVGHFDLWHSENAVMFRHALLLPGGIVATAEQCESMLKIAVDACERYFQAFQFVVWAGKGAREALSGAMFDTVGEA